MQGVAYPHAPCGMGGVLKRYHVDSLWVVRGHHMCIAHEILVVASMRLLWRYFIGSNTW